MILRAYAPSDCKVISELFYETVHSVNIRDYSKEQIDAWADGNIDLKKWNESFLTHYTIIAEEDGSILGFGDITRDGYLDRLYVHKDFQRKGIASAICTELENHINSGKITTAASITARPFFEKRGYITVRAQLVKRHGIFLKNFVMEKTL